MQARNWFWLRTRIFGLFGAADTRVSRHFTEQLAPPAAATA